MTSAKHYSNWLKEAGRGHIGAILAWGGFCAVSDIQSHVAFYRPTFAFSGIGSAELSYLCMGLGEFIGVFRIRLSVPGEKQDFY